MAPGIAHDVENRASRTPVLAVENLSKRFGAVQALDDVSLAVGAGEIRAICGENGAGKSTLVKILTGVYTPDAGHVLIDGAPVSIAHPSQAQALGLALVAQELSLVPELSVHDNIWLGNARVPLFHKRRRFRDESRRVLEMLGLGHVALDTPVRALGIGERQLVEIARMLARDARVLILDEPTATLTDRDIARIFAALRALKEEGRSIIYITHRLGEVFEICDSVTVLRNGAPIGTWPAREIDRARLIEAMLGRALGEMYPEAGVGAGEAMLSVRGLAIPGIVAGFDLEAPRGRIVCLAGQIGSGAAEVVRALAGLAHDATGEVTVAGRRLALGSAPRAVAANVRFISEDRAEESVFLRLRTRDNLVATRLAEHARHGLLSWPKLHATAEALARRVGVDTARLAALTEELSGGNQQKVAFGRSIRDDEPGVLLMNEPTRGVDVGARADIYEMMRGFCGLGYALVMTTTDLEEALGIADTIVTMYRGRVVNRYARADATMHAILADITHPEAA